MGQTHLVSFQAASPEYMHRWHFCWDLSSVWSFNVCLRPHWNWTFCSKTLSVRPFQVPPGISFLYSSCELPVLNFPMPPPFCTPFCCNADAIPLNVPDLPFFQLCPCDSNNARVHIKDLRLSVLHSSCNLVLCSSNSSLLCWVDWFSFPSIFHPPDV